jgi:hypothetical protein
MDETHPKQAELADRAGDDGECWLCGAPTEERHCKIVCRNCGFMRDCSDP